MLYRIMRHSITTIIIALLVSLNAFAQNQWNITTGYLHSDIKTSAAKGGSTLTTNINGFYVGAGYDWGLLICLKLTM